MELTQAIPAFAVETSIVTAVVAQMFPCPARRENYSVTSSETVSTYLARSVQRQISVVSRMIRQQQRDPQQPSSRGTARLSVTEKTWALLDHAAECNIVTAAVMFPCPVRRESCSVITSETVSM